MGIFAILKLIDTGFGIVGSVFGMQRFLTVRKIPLNAGNKPDTVLFFMT
jgi:hypothetical protein